MGRHNKQKFVETTQRKKLYKSGKNWVISGTTFLALFGLNQLLTLNVHADTSSLTAINTSSNSVTNSQQAVVAKVANSYSSSNGSSNATSGSALASSTISNGSSNATSGSSLASSTISNGSSNATSGSSLASSTISNGFSNATSGSSLASSTISNGSSNATSGSSLASSTISNGSSNATSGSSLASSTISNGSSNATSSGSSISSNDSSSHAISNGVSSITSGSSLTNSSSTMSLVSGSASNASTTSSANSNASVLALNANVLDTMLSSNTDLKNQVVSKFALQSVDDVDLGAELMDRIGTDTTQAQTLMSLVNYNPVTSYGLVSSLTFSNQASGSSGQLTLAANVLSNSSVSNASSTYPQYMKFGTNASYYYVLKNDDKGNSPFSNINSITLNTVDGGQSQTSNIALSTNNGPNIGQGIYFNTSVTKDDMYAQSFGGMPLNINDKYWSDTALANGTRTYTIFKLDSNPAQLNTLPNRYMTSGDSIAYTINYTSNNSYTGSANNQGTIYYNKGAISVPKVNYIDKNGNQIQPSQYFDAPGTTLSSGASYTATVPASAGYVPYLVSFNMNYNGSVNSSIKPDNTVSLSGTLAIDNASFDLSNFDNNYNVTYVKPQLQTNTKTFTRNVNYVDTNGNQLATGNTQTVMMTQTAVYDALTNTLLGYVPAGQTFTSNFSGVRGLKSNNDNSTWNYTNGNQFNSVSAQDLSSQGYQPIDISSVNAETVNPNSNNETYNIVYNKVPTQPASVSGTLVRNVTLVDANTNQTINYNNGQYNGGQLTQQIGSSQAPQATYQTPSASTDANVVKVNQYITGYTLGGVTLTLPNASVPDLSSLGYTSGSPTSIDAISANYTKSGQDTQTQNVVIKYNHATTVVKSTNPENSGTTIAGTNTHYPSGVSTADLNQHATRIISYVDETDPFFSQIPAPNVTQSVLFTRDAIVDNVTGQLLGYTNSNSTNIVNANDAWTVQGQFDAVTSPDLTSKGYVNPSLSVVAAQIPNAPDSSSGPSYYDDVSYNRGKTIVSHNQGANSGSLVPGTDVKYQSGLSFNDLNRFVTRTIHYQDSQNPNNSVASDNVQTVHYYRNAQVDNVTGALNGYVDSNGNYLSDQDSWLSDDNSFSTVTSPDLTSKGYLAPSLASVNSSTPSVNDQNSVINVNYAHDTEIVSSTQPKTNQQVIDNGSANYPNGVSQSDLNHDVTQTIQYQDANTGQSIAPNNVQTVHFYRNAKVDKVTGQLLGYVDDNGDLLGNQSTWLSNNDTYNSVTSPEFTSKGYVLPNISIVNDSKPSVKDSNSLITVIYGHGTATVFASQPKTTQDTISGTSTNYPIGLTQSDLNHYVTQTIHYQDSTNGQKVYDDNVQTLHYYRNAKVDKVTGQLLGYTDDDGNLLDNQNKFISKYVVYGTVDSPDLTQRGYSQPDTDIVYGVTTNQDSKDTTKVVSYGHLTTLVSASNPVSSDTMIPNSLMKYPSGLTASDLNHSVSRTVKYQDAVTHQTMAPDSTTTVSFYRNAVIDNVTGKLIGYADDSGNVFSDQTQWLSHQTYFLPQPSPDFTGFGYEWPSELTVGYARPSVTDSDSTIVVTYAHQMQVVTPDAPKNTDDHMDMIMRPYPKGVSKDDLNRQITRTINYQNTRGQSIAPSTVQIVKYQRSALVDMATGQLVGYLDANGKVLANGDDTWTSSDNHFDQVQIPDLTNLGYDTPNDATVNNQTVKFNDANSLVNKIYNDHLVTINSNQPKTNTDVITGTNIHYPSGVSTGDLNQNRSRVVQYIDSNTGNSLADSTVQTAHFTRNAVVNVATGEVVSYTPWQANDNHLNGFSIPYPDDYNLVGNTTINGYINGLTLNVNDNDVVQTVEYTKVPTLNTSVMPTPSANKPQTGQPVAPQVQRINHHYVVIDGQHFNQRSLPHGINPLDLHRQVIRTINYVDVNGHSLRPSTVQTVNYYRNLIIDTTTNQVIGYTNGHSFKPMLNSNAAWYSSNNQFKDLRVPKLHRYGYGHANIKRIAAKIVHVNDHNEIVNVVYTKSHVKSHAKPGNESHMHISRTNKHVHETQPNNKSHLSSATMGPSYKTKPSLHHQAEYVGKQLPQTGENNDELLTLIGLLSVLTSSLYLGFSFKKRFEKD